MYLLKNIYLNNKIIYYKSLLFTSNYLITAKCLFIKKDLIYSKFWLLEWKEPNLKILF